MVVARSARCMPPASARRCSRFTPGTPGSSRSPARQTSHSSSVCKRNTRANDAPVCSTSAEAIELSSTGSSDVTAMSRVTRRSISRWGFTILAKRLRIPKSRDMPRSHKGTRDCRGSTSVSLGASAAMQDPGAHRSRVVPALLSPPRRTRAQFNQPALNSRPNTSPSAFRLTPRSHADDQTDRIIAAALVAFGEHGYAKPGSPTLRGARASLNIAVLALPVEGPRSFARSFDRP